MVNGKITTETLANLSLQELTVFSRFHGAMERCGFTNTQEESGCASSLSKKGFIKPFGKIGNRIRWQAAEMNIDCRRLLKQLANPELLEIYARGAA